MDWCEFVEMMSIVDQKLCEDFEDFYSWMEFVSCDCYCYVVEKLVKCSFFFECEVVCKVVQFVYQVEGGDLWVWYVGFYLIDDGLQYLEYVVEVCLMFGDFLKWLGFCLFLFFYFGFIVLIVLIFIVILFVMVYCDGLVDWMLVLIVVLVLFVVSQLVVILVNWLVILFVVLYLLFWMDFVKGIVFYVCMLVVVLIMLISLLGVDELVEVLEVCFFVNCDVYLYFGLLIDFCDVVVENQLEDDVLVE